MEKILSSRLRIIRKALNKTQKEFAEALDTVQGVISDIENGRKQLSRALITSIVEKFNIDATWLITGEGEMFREKAPPIEEDDDDDFPEDPEQGMAMLDSMLGMLIKKGVISESDIPPPLAGVKRKHFKMKENARKILERDLERARVKEAKIKSEQARIEAELEKYTDADEAQENAPKYGPFVELPLYEIGSDGHFDEKDVSDEPKTSRVVMVGKVAAGIPIEMISDGTMVTIETAFLPVDAKECFAVRVEGTSMIGADIHDGDYALIRSASVPVHGQIMLVAHDNESTLKLVKETPEEVRRFHLYFVDGSGQEILAEEDGTDWRIIGSYVCTFKPKSN